MNQRLFAVLYSLFLFFNAAGQCEGTEIAFISTTAQWGEEMGWELYHQTEYDTTLISSFQGEFNGQTTIDILCLEDGCYTLLATDSWGDGWNGGSLAASPLEITDVLDGFDGPFNLNDGSYGYHTFTVGDGACTFVIPGCTDPTALNYVIGATVDDGSCIEIEQFGVTDNGISALRQYIYYAPQNMQPGAPLVFVLHGYSGSASSIYGFSGFREVADEEGFGVVFPQGAQDGGGPSHWNANFNFSNVNDHAFLTQLAEHLQSEHGHDPDCTYSCGYSNGGYMSYSLACDNADTFRGIGIVGGNMGGNDWGSCSPSQPVPVVHIHGTLDNDVPYNGSPFDPGNWGGAPSVEAVVATWAGWNNCTEVSETALPNLDPTDGSTVDLIAHSGGDYGYEARLYRVNNGGHDWFGSWGNFDITSAAEMWSFWSQFCGAPISVPELRPEMADLLDWNGRAFTAKQPCQLQVFDTRGRMVMERPMMGGQSVPFNGCGQVYLWSARGASGDVQQQKIWAD